MRKIFVIIAGAMLLFSCNGNDAKDKTSQPVLLSHTNNKASCVYITQDQNNKPMISWCEENTTGKKLFFMSFFDGKKNAFDSAIVIPIEQNTVFMEEAMPKIAMKSDGTVLAVYETVAPTAKNKWAGFVHYIQSFDKGKTWTQPLCVHQDTTSGKNHGYVSIARLSDGEIGACWLDESLADVKLGRSIEFAKTNGRSGFQNEILIDSFACQCCRTAISSGDKGNVNIMFRNIAAGSVRDITASTSRNNGKVFSPAVTFSNDNWVIDGCPEDGPSVADKNKNTYAAWFTGGKIKGIFYAELNNDRAVVFKKQISNKGRFIQLCLLPGGERIIAYNENVKQADSIYSKIILNRVDEKNQFFTADVTQEKVHANYPVLSSLDADHIVVAWTDNNTVYYRMMDTDKINKSLQSNANVVAEIVK